MPFAVFLTKDAADDLTELHDYISAKENASQRHKTRSRIPA